MLKYTEAVVGFSEVPGEISLCINISNCPIHCKGCHSPHLWKDIGTELSTKVLSHLIDINDGITCVTFMGGDSSPKEVEKLATWVKKTTNLGTCWYSGKDYIIESDITDISAFDYIKIGHYSEAEGGLDSPATNQKFYEIKYKTVPIYGIVYPVLEDITFKFKHNETDNKN